MRIAVVGAGGVGGFFGALLARGGAEVVFIARGAHLEAMLRHGLRIEGGGHRVHLPGVRATADPREVGVVDVVMVCVKLWDLETALEQIRPLVGPRTVVVSFQNGVLKDERLMAAFGEERVIGGVSYVATRIVRPGVIGQTGSLQRLIFGEFDGRDSERVGALHQACAAGGISAEVSPDIRQETWRKFVFLVGLSATTATTRLPIGAVRENARSRALLLDIMREVVTVAQALGVALPDGYAQECMTLMDGLAYDMASSLYHDLERGQRLEVPWLSGGVVELGHKAGVDTPLNRAVADILAPHADGRPRA
ncbi:2-dehydropantoate 2-reductase [Nonomuraea sp. NPDC050202]|uniref:ketopantoate reductase family protein n=1 Tax=unclassified Nonomuraea TaxID=2593643 RepID=UPI0034035834